MRRFWVTIVAMKNHCSECVFLDLVIQHAKHLYRVMSSVASPALQNFSTLSHKQQDFRKEVLEHTHVFIFSTNLCETFLILRKIG
jgi:hypothetical protein